MKKGFIFFTVLLFFCNVVFAAADEEEILQTINWESVENAHKYEVQIEHYNDATQWDEFYKQITSESSIEIPFVPGRYRIKINPVNYLGKTVDQGQWLIFRILTEEEWQRWQQEKNQKEKQPVFEDEEVIEILDNTKTKSIWFNNLRISADVPLFQEYNFYMNFRLDTDIITLDWFYWDAGINFTPKMVGTILNYDWEYEVAMETSVNFLLSLKYASPHVGLLAGYVFANQKGIVFADKNMYTALEAGVLLWKYVDVKVYAGFNDLLNSRDFFLSLGLGGRIPLK